MTLTHRGWALLIASVLALVGGVLFGIEELISLAVGSAVLLAACAGWVRAHRWDVLGERHVQPRITAGSTAPVRITLVNPTARPSPMLALRDPFDRQRRSVNLRVAPLAPDARLEATYHLPPLARGRYSVGPLELSFSDPFEMVRMTRRGAAASPVTVHPRVLSVGSAAVGDGLEPDALPGEGRFGATGDEFSALRPYQEGDDLRQIHWASTARLNDVMVRQQDVVRHRRATVAVDLRDLWDGPTLEDALGAAGGVLQAVQRSGGQIRLITTAGADTGFGATLVHWGLVLDVLATVTVTEDRAGLPLGGLLPSVRHPEGTSATFTVLTSSAASDADLASLRMVAEPSALVVAVFDAGVARRSVPSKRPTPVPGRLLRVPKGGFTKAWGAQSRSPVGQSRR